ncbi:MAG TPA: ABC transporter ATP-binding protein [Chloroflexi bacterium]|nr:ABC transporter ATP-binding protein [Chloroflexota bacterium]
MAWLTASKLTKYYGAQQVFTALSLQVDQGERVALVGANGCGKSTLLDILAGVLEPDAGTVHLARGRRLGYLPQRPDLSVDGTLWSFMKEAFVDLRRQEADLRRLEVLMGAEEEAVRERAMVQYGKALEDFERAGGFIYEARIRQVLGGLGFQPSQFEQPVAQLSGGEKTRAQLARLLLENPDVLLLDEPTNHLDLEGIEWLEGYLSSWQGAMVVVAHDRAFLDAVATRVLELEGGRLESYTGNFSAYVQQRNSRRARQAAEYEAQRRYIEKTEDYIRRYMAGQRSSQAKGRLKRLQRLTQVERPRQARSIHIDLQTSMRSGDLVLGLYQLAAGYQADRPLVTVEEAEIRRGQRVALVGPNGVGKTTLLRTILRQIPPLSGRVRLGAAVRIGYFAQVQDHLVPGKSVLDTVLDGGLTSVAATRDFLARYGFRGDDVFKDTGVLSGGERARLSIAILSLAKANFLLLDEPTNHLDIASQEVLEEVLRAFNGTILLVSHDRYLIRRLATAVWAIADGRLHVFDEGYEAYQAWHQAQREGDDQQEHQKTRQRADAARQAKRARQQALARQQERLETLEQEIHALEGRLRELTHQLEIAGRAQDVARVTRLGAEYRQIESKLDRLLEEWAEVANSVAA